jgi:hypothetical protein
MFSRERCSCRSTTSLLWNSKSASDGTEYTATTTSAHTLAYEYGGAHGGRDRLPPRGQKFGGPSASIEGARARPKIESAFSKRRRVARLSCRGRHLIETCS